MLEANIPGYPLPAWSSPSEIERALAAAVAATDKPSAMTAYHELLYAVGNNHAGTYYPGATLLVQALGPLLREGQIWTRFAALEVLTDLSGSFQPEQGFESVSLPDGSTRSTSVVVREAMLRLTDVLNELLTSKDCSNAERETVGELLRQWNE